MDLSREADIYAPNIDKNGNYVDIIPSFNYGNGFYIEGEGMIQNLISGEELEVIGNIYENKELLEVAQWT